MLIVPVVLLSLMVPLLINHVPLHVVITVVLEEVHVGLFYMSLVETLLKESTVALLAKVRESFQLLCCSHEPLYYLLHYKTLTLTLLP